MQLRALPMIALGLLAIALPASLAQAGPYRVVKTARVGGEGGFDYVYADSAGRKLYIARTGATPRIDVYNLDTLESLGGIPQVNAHGVASDTASHHGFSSSRPMAMWDTETLKRIKDIDVEGRPDGILNDAFNHRTYVFSHAAPNVTVIEASTGARLGTIDLGGAPEQAVADGQGRLYVDIEDKGSVAVLDGRTLKVTATYALAGKGGGNAGLALDAANQVLFVACRDPQVMVMLDALSGRVVGTLPIGRGCDGAVFNPATGEAFSSQGDGTLTVIKETSPTTFAVEQTVTTMPGAKSLTLDRRTGRILLIAAEFGPAPAGGRRGPMVPGSFTILVVAR
jgi:DNA-binding beta-propeller fold protein YncE